MFDLYHGNDKMRTISHVKLLCDGIEMFEDLFEDRVDNVVNRSSQIQGTKQLKPLYSRTEKAFYLGKHIDLQTMSSVNFASKTLASGRMLKWPSLLKQLSTELELDDIDSVL